MSFINLDKVIGKLRNPNNSIFERKEAAKLLSQSGSEAAVDALIDFLPDPTLRLDVVIALGRLAKPKALKYLLTTLFDSVDEVKLEIIRAIRKIGDSKIVGPLIQFFKQETNENVMAATFILISQYGNLETVSQIIPMSLKAQYTSVQILTLKYLHEQGDKRLSNMVYPLLFTDDPKVKAMAGEVLWKFEGLTLLKKLNYILIKTKDLKKRLDVAYVYGELGMIDEVAPLVYTLTNDTTEPLRIEILKALRKIGDVRALKPIAKLLFSSTEKVMAECLETLSYFNRPEIPKIVSRFLQHKSEIVRKAAMEAFSRIVTPMDLQTLKGFFNSEDNDNLIYVISIIGNLEIMDDDIRNFLKKNLKHENNEIVINTCQTLGKLKDNSLLELIMENFNHESDEVRTNAIKASSKIGDDRILTKIAELYKTDKSNKVRATIINTMGDFGKKTFMSTVREALGDMDARVRSNAIEAMEAMGGEEIVDYIFPLIDDENNRVKANAAKTLWQFGGIRMIGVLEKMLLREKDKWQRASAAFSLGEIGALQVVKPLILAIKDEEDCVRANVVKALGKTKSREVVPEIINCLKDPSERVREEAVIGLGTIGGLKILDPIIEYLRDHNEHIIMDKIFDSIEGCVDNNFLMPLTKLVQDEGGLIKILATKLLADIGEEYTIPILKELLDDGNVNIRTTAEISIRKILDKTKIQKEIEKEKQKEKEQEEKAKKDKENEEEGSGDNETKTKE